MVLTFDQMSFFIENFENIKDLEDLNLSYDQTTRIREILDRVPQIEDTKKYIVRAKIQKLLDKFTKIQNEEAEFYKHNLLSQMASLKDSDYPVLTLNLSSEEIKGLSSYERSLYYEINQLMRY